MSHYDWLIEKLDAFVRRYYANKMLRGGLVLLICLLAFVLMASIGEYFLFLPAAVKLVLVSLLAVLGGGALVGWVLLPLSKMARLGKVISHEQAAVIVGQHFPEISDKLLNILQLKKQSDGHFSRELVEASIEQKSNQISVFPIAKAVDFSLNKKYLKYLLPLVGISVLIFIFYPSIFMDASVRLLQPTKTFEKPAPFEMRIESLPLQAIRNADYTLKVSVDGASLPADMMVAIEGDKLIMQPIDKTHFQYTFKNVTDPIKFKLFAAGFFSKEYELKVAQKPVLKAFQMKFVYPAYTGKQAETKNSLSDVTIPEGTTISWVYNTEHTDAVGIRFGYSPERILSNNSGRFTHEARFLTDTNYTVTLYNKASNVKDSFQYHVQVIQDQYPVIQLQEFKDSVTGKQILLTGTFGDDYGISKGIFHYEILNEKNQKLQSKEQPLKIEKGLLSQFQQYFDIASLDLLPGQKVNYFVEAWDNDGVHGSKATRSETMSYLMYTPNQLDSAINANSKQINSGLSNSAQQTKQMQTDVRELQNKMLQSDKMDWEQQQSLQELAKQQQDLQKNLENIKKRFEEEMQQSKQKNLSDDLKEKQEDLKQQLDNLLNNELKEQMKKLEDLMAKLNKENAFQEMKKMEEENKLFNMDLERMKELMKKMEMQMRMEDMANKMEQLAQKELELKKETELKQKGSEELSKKQDDIKKELNDAMKEQMKDINNLNKEMKQHQDMSNVEQGAKDAQENMEQSEQQLNQNQNNKASESQSKAAENMKQMAASLSQMAGGMEMEQLDIDIKAVRQLLSNLMRLSFDQESLMNKSKTTAVSSPVYLDNIEEQKRLHDNSLMIRDSLFSLSKRMFKLAQTVNKETTEMERNMQASLSAFEDRKIGESITRQQYVMTKANNLALMLNEMLSNLMQMQSQSQSQSDKQGSCKKPGGKTPKPGAGKQLSDIISKQQQMGGSMQQMQGQQQQGKQGDKQGKEGKSQNQSGKEGDGEYGNSEQLARMAQQQAAIRRQLQSLLNSKSGTAVAKELREIQDKMDRNETDLVNRRLTNELIQRQKEIMTRLLETEKAMRQQEQDDKRSSNTAQEIAKPVPAELQKHEDEKLNLMEFYKTVPPQLKPYYKGLVEKYFNDIGNHKSN
jgi:hypothetical protein